MKPGILAIDIGGSRLKAEVLSAAGKPLSERLRVDTPHPCPPALLVSTVATLAQPLPAYDRIAVGFPGVVRAGRVLTAPNLDTELWAGFDLAAALSKALNGYPVRVINDAEMQGLALASGKGLELVLTLGTGFGSALFRDGELMPHMELGQHPAHKRKTYDQYLGNAAFEEVGQERWNKRLRRALTQLSVLLNPDRIVIGGGNVKYIEGELPQQVSLGSNLAGLVGGAALWKQKADHLKRH